MKKLPILTVTLALALSGCISFGAEPPASLLTLTSTSAPPVGQMQDSTGTRSIVVAVPTTPASIGQQRVPVQSTPTSIAYVREAQWSEPPARLFVRLMADTIGARTGRIALTPSQAGDTSDQLDGDLRNFGLDATTREAIVTFDATLTRDGSEGVRTRRFEARVPVSAIDAASAAPALNRAANEVAVQVADWIGR